MGRHLAGKWFAIRVYQMVPEPLRVIKERLTATTEALMMAAGLPAGAGRA